MHKNEAEVLRTQLINESYYFSSNHNKLPDFFPNIQTANSCVEQCSLPSKEKF